ncbi:MAG: toprim domain-containing protein [Asticcacaulis sp.]
MSMRQDIYEELLPRLMSDYGFKDRGTWLQSGKCPACNRREFFTRKENPWVLKCGRANKCGREYAVKDLYPEIFDNWSNRYKRTPEAPNAAADAYLSHSRRLSLAGLLGCYSQEIYRDDHRNLTSASIRFTLPNGATWERIIDQPSRFDRKAHFKGSYGGYGWLAPDQGYEVLARAHRVWITEGIFDALSWRQVGECAVSAMSTNNYPEAFLDQLRKTCADLGVRLPELVFAFDAGKAGTEFTLNYVDRAIEDGWRATAAQPVGEGEPDDHDWNELLGRERLTPEHIDTYLWNGRILLARTATEKALLLWEKRRWPSFSFVHDSRTWWASIDAARVKEIMDKEDVTETAAARHCLEVTCISNCAFRVLYFQTDEVSQESHYYLAIDLHGNDQTYRARFSPAALAAGSEFKKALIGAAPGALWEGSTRQLDRIVSQQTLGLKTVETLDYTGYSKEHGAYVLGDLAVKGGKVLQVNSEDFFDLGSRQVKLRSPVRLLHNDYDAEQFRTDWLDTVFTAWRGNGLVAVTFWVMAFFAEQIRKEQASLGYLEMSGKANTGKSTIVLFLWKLTGLLNESYEGIDPSKSTMVGYIRTLSRAANLPVVFVESDRKDDMPHAKRFDWDEIKGLFNGQIGRATGKKTQGNDTYEPPFRGALIIEQNHPVNGDEPVLSRIMQTEWTKDGWSTATKAAAEKIEKWDRDELSGARRRT